MKTDLLPAIAAAIAALTLATSAFAVDDGIAAPPRVRQMLNERELANSPSVAARPAMSCPKCADVRIVKVNRPAKGAEILMGANQVAYTHACTACETKMTLVGEGKAKHVVATHSCSLAIASNPTCCASN